MGLWWGEEVGGVVEFGGLWGCCLLMLVRRDGVEMLGISLSTGAVNMKIRELR